MPPFFDKSVSSLLVHLLKNADEAQLTDDQVQRLAVIYFRFEGVPLLSELEGVVSAAQLRLAMKAYLNFLDRAESTVGGEDLGNAEQIRRIELELSERVASRLLGWSKLLAACIGIPVAVALSVIGFLGVKSYSDLKGLNGQAESIVAQGKNDLSAISSRQHELEQRLADVASGSKSNKQELDAIQCKVQQLQQRLGEGAARLISGGQEADAGLIVTLRPDVNGLGKAYGPWAIPAEAAAHFLQGYLGAALATRPSPGSSEFDELWRSLARKDGDKFRVAQREFIRNDFDASVKMISDKEGIDVRKLSLELQEAIFDWTELAGPGSKVFHAAAETLRSRGDWQPGSPSFDNKLLEAFMANLRATPYFSEHPAAFVQFDKAVRQISTVRVDGTAGCR